jgi:hypothetical protein
VNQRRLFSGLTRLNEIIGRDDRIRTYDPHTPSVMRYQAALRPDRKCGLRRVFWDSQVFKQQNQKMRVSVATDPHTTSHVTKLVPLFNLWQAIERKRAVCSERRRCCAAIPMFFPFLRPDRHLWITTNLLN